MSPDSTLLIERENDAEHTGMMAIQIAICDSIIPLEVNRSKLYRMAAVHDLPEVLAGDTWYLDPEKKYRNEIECVKAREIFAKHPDLMELWIEAKEHKTLEGIYCKSFDILQAVTAVYINKGYTWRLNKVTYEKETGFSAWIWQDESNPIGALLRILFHDALEQELFYKGK
jgi:hypothetical protein